MIELFYKKSDNPSMIRWIIKNGNKFDALESADDILKFRNTWLNCNEFQKFTHHDLVKTYDSMEEFKNNFKNDFLEEFI